MFWHDRHRIFDADAECVDNGLSLWALCECVCAQKQLQIDWLTDWLSGSSLIFVRKSVFMHTIVFIFRFHVVADACARLSLACARVFSYKIHFFFITYLCSLFYRIELLCSNENNGINLSTLNSAENKVIVSLSLPPLLRFVCLRAHTHRRVSAQHTTVENSQVFRHVRRWNSSTETTRQRCRPKSNNNQRIAANQRKNCETRCIFWSVCKATQATAPPPLPSPMLRKQNAFGVITNNARRALLPVVQITSACYIVKLVWLFANNKLRNGKI